MTPTLHVETEGSGNAIPVVFLHGVTSSGKTWDWLPDEVTRGRRIVRMDFRGHGRSSHTPGHYRLPDYGGDVAGVLQDLGTAVLVGHSLGGVVAWWVAQNHPELVRAALLEDPPLLAADGSPERIEKGRSIFSSMLETVRRNRAAGLSDEQSVKVMGDAMLASRGGAPFREVAMDDAVAAMAFGHQRLDEGVIEGAIDRSTLADTNARSPVHRPVLILAADDAFGAAFSSQDEKQLAATHPDIEVIRIAGCGHGIHDDRRNRDTFVRHLCTFLDRYAPRTKSASLI